MIENAPYTSWTDRIKNPVAVILATLAVYGTTVKHAESAFAPPANKYQVSLESINNKDITFDKECHVILGKYKNILGYKITDGNIFMFNAEYLETVKKKAKETGEIEILDILPIRNETSVRQWWISDDERIQRVAECISSKELTQRGIYIHNADNIELFIRPSAFDQDGVFAEYKVGGPKSLHIFLGNGPAMVYPYFENIPFLDKSLNVLNDRLDRPSASEFRQSKIKEFSTLIDSIRKIKTPNKDDMDRLSESKIKLKLYQNPEFYSDKNIIDTILNNDESLNGKGGNPVGGAYAVSVNEDHIYIATGKLDRDRFLVMFAKPDGSFGLNYVSVDTDVSTPLFKRNLSVEEFDSQPNENSYPDAGRYSIYDKVEGGSIGGIINHEVAHVLRHNNNEKQTDRLRALNRKYNENRTDKLALANIKKASDPWLKSGFKDDYKYPFVFREKKTGAVMVTQAPSPTHAI